MEIPRRNRLGLNTPAELAIYNAMQEVEKLEANVKLTNAIQLLSKAKDLISDFVDKVEESPKKVYLIERVEDCKKVKEENIRDGHDCWGNLEWSSQKYIYVNKEKKMCFDRWYVVSFENEVIDVVSEFLIYKYK